VGYALTVTVTPTNSTQEVTVDKLFPIDWQGSIEGRFGFVAMLAIVVAVNCLILAAYVFTACFIVWLWFGGAL